MHENVYAGSFYLKKLTTQTRYSQRLLRNITAATQLTLLIKWRSVHKRLCILIHVDNGTEKYELAYRRNHKWKKIVASRSTVLNKNKIIQYADYGVPVSSDNAEGVVRYIGAYESENERKIPFVRSTDRIGWMGNEFFPYVVDGEVLYENNEGTELVDSLNESGSFEVWMQMALKLREEIFARAILAASFVSPLLELLQMRVIILHLWHSSRSGKTAILKFALSIWGDPLKLMGNFTVRQSVWKEGQVH